MSDENIPDLYAVLGFTTNTKDVCLSDIKKAYYKLALKYHPDRYGPESSVEATQKFQQIQFAYSILSDEGKRANYDKTGSVEESYAEYEEIHVTLQDIEAFKEKYIGSNEEKEDLIKLYQTHKGDMTKVIDDMFFGDYEKEERYRSILQKEIDGKTVKVFKKFNSKISKRKRNAAIKEAEEAIQHAKDLGLKTDDDLSALILKRQESRFDAMMKNIEEKYAKKSNSTKRSKANLNSGNKSEN
jgi:DnaJ family protein C protein 9